MTIPLSEATAIAVPPLRTVRARIADELTRLLQFARRPTRSHPHTLPRSDLGVRLLILLVALFLFHFLTALPVNLVLQKLVGLRYLPDISTLRFFINAVCFAPLIEELMFRAGLRSATFTLGVQPVLLSLVFYQGAVLLALACVVCAWFWLSRTRLARASAAERFSIERARSRAYLANYRFIVWGYALVFGLVHAGNFGVNAGSGWLGGFVILACVSQTFSGVVLSFLRLRYGLAAAMLFHAMFNSTAVLLDRLT